MTVYAAILRNLLRLVDQLPGILCHRDHQRAHARSGSSGSAIIAAGTVVVHERLEAGRQRRPPPGDAAHGAHKLGPEDIVLIEGSCAGATISIRSCGARYRPAYRRTDGRQARSARGTPTKSSCWNNVAAEYRYGRPLPVERYGLQRRVTAFLKYAGGAVSAASTRSTPLARAFVYAIVPGDCRRDAVGAVLQPRGTDALRHAVLLLVPVGLDCRRRPSSPEWPTGSSADAAAMQLGRAVGIPRSLRAVTVMGFVASRWRRGDSTDSRNGAWPAAASARSSPGFCSAAISIPPTPSSPCRRWCLAPARSAFSRCRTRSSCIRSSSWCFRGCGRSRTSTAT